MEKSTMPMAIFNGYVTICQRLFPIHNPMKNHHFPMVFLWFSYGFHHGILPRRIRLRALCRTRLKSRIRCGSCSAGSVLAGQASSVNWWDVSHGCHGRVSKLVVSLKKRIKSWTEAAKNAEITMKDTGISEICGDKMMNMVCILSGWYTIRLEVYSSSFNQKSFHSVGVENYSCNIRQRFKMGWIIWYTYSYRNISYRYT